MTDEELKRIEAECEEARGTYANGDSREVWSVFRDRVPELMAEVRRLRGDVDEPERSEMHTLVGWADQPRLTWCGATLVGEAHFVDASHVLLALKKGTSSDPCKACLQQMLVVVEAELKG